MRIRSCPASVALGLALATTCAAAPGRHELAHEQQRLSEIERKISTRHTLLKEARKEGNKALATRYEDELRILDSKRRLQEMLISQIESRPAGSTSRRNGRQTARRNPPRNNY